MKVVKDKNGKIIYTVEESNYITSFKVSTNMLRDILAGALLFFLITFIVFITALI